MLVRAGAFGGPCFVGVVEEGFAVVVEDGAGGRDGDSGVILYRGLSWRCCCDLWVADCYVAVVVPGYLDSPLCADPGCCRFQIWFDLLQGKEVVA